MSIEPLELVPYLRPQVWGGRQLASSLGKSLPGEGTFGESWEVSGHSLHVSRVARGRWEGWDLVQLSRRIRADLFGDVLPPDERFPLLVKFLDCQGLLSVQVHPNDELAARFTKGDTGKTEAWVVLAAKETGRIYAGLKDGVTRRDLERHLIEGTVDHCLHEFHPKAGDCLFLPAGTVHAVGGGVLLAEAQQSSDATFRLFDWNRGRELHIEPALASVDYRRGPLSPRTPVLWKAMPTGIRAEALCICSYFAMDRFEIRETLPSPYAGRMAIWMVLDGSALLAHGKEERLFPAGRTVIVPAVCDARWRPARDGDSTTLLAITLPDPGLM